MEWRVYILTGGKRFCYYTCACEAHAIDKRLVLEHKHDSRYQFEIEPHLF